MILEQGEGPFAAWGGVGSGGREVDGGSVHWGCCNKIPLYHRLSDLKTVEINCSQVLKAGSPRIRVPAWPGSC